MQPDLPDPETSIMRIRLSLAVLWTLLILALCWTPADWLPVKEGEGSGWEIPYMDKMVHAGLFVGFAVLWMEALAGKGRRELRVAVAAFALAAISELGQLIPAIKRDGEFADAAADFVGVLVGLCVFRLLDELRQRWIGRQLTVGTTR
jgi:hypothetical protein